MSLPVIHDEHNRPWFHQGLRFSCTGCGQCCTGAPGYVWVTKEEIHQLAEYLQLSFDEFEKKYLRLIDGRSSLVEDPISYDCIFLKENRCSVYPHRPKQCRTFPWWIDQLESPQAWKEAAKMCEGIHAEAPLHSQEEIESILTGA